MFRQTLFTSAGARRLPGIALQLLLVFALAVWCTWMGLGRGYQEGQDHGYEVGRLAGYKYGYRLGVRDGFRRANAAAASSEDSSLTMVAQD